MSVQVKVRGVVRKDNKILLCKLKDRFRCLPGGTLEGGETREQCLKREIFEELGREIEVGTMIYMQEFIDGERTVLDFWYEVLYLDHFETIDLSSTSHGFELEKVAFVDLETTMEDIKPSNLREILSTL